MAHGGYVTTDDAVRLFVRRVGDRSRLLVVPNGIPLLHDFEPLTATRTIVAFDPRNRGESDTIIDEGKLERGVDHDVEDLEAIRRDLRAERIDLLGHSYVGLVVILYAMKYPQHVGRVIQIGSVGPDGRREYRRSAEDERFVNDVLGRIRALHASPATSDPEELCRRSWELLREIYVVDPKDATRLDAWQRCHLANERAAFSHVAGRIMPSIQRIALAAADLETVSMPVLTIHGERDRSAAHEGSRDWVRRLPNARLVSIPDAGHMPWIEAPREVFAAIGNFLTSDVSGVRFA